MFVCICPSSPVRLVNNCWCALVRYSEEMIPLHPCLQLISNCEQTLSSHTSRRLITMEKIKEPEVCAFILFCVMEHLMQFKHPHFHVCVVLWFHCQQSPHRCSSPTCAHYRMFTLFYEHEQETCTTVKQKRVFALFSCFFCASFKQWCLDM